MLLDLIPILGKVFDRVIPDPAAAADAKLKVMQLAQTGELEALHADTQLALGQLEINKVEAASSSLFKSGWRPYIGWTCGAAFSYKFVLAPIGLFVMAALGHPIILPVLDFTEMLTVLLGMLGLGGMRTYEKIKGAA